MTEEQAAALIALQQKNLAVNRRILSNVLWFFWLSIFLIFGWGFVLLFMGALANAFSG